MNGLVARQMFILGGLCANAPTAWEAERIREVAVDLAAAGDEAAQAVALERLRALAESVDNEPLYEVWRRLALVAA